MTQTQTQFVALVRYVSECDVEEVPGVPRRPYDQQVAELRRISQDDPRRLRDYDIVYVNEDGTLGRFASWAL